MCVSGHFPADSLGGSTLRESRLEGHLDLQLFKDDLNFAIKLPHVQQECYVIAIMLNDVVVHVDQDSGREEKIGIWWVLYFQVFLINKEYSHVIITYWVVPMLKEA